MSSPTLGGTGNQRFLHRAKYRYESSAQNRTFKGKPSPAAPVDVACPPSKIKTMSMTMGIGNTAMATAQSGVGWGSS